MIPITKMLTYGLEYFGLYYGTYRGQVKSTSDPENIGRIQVHCPAIHGDQFPPVWAVPVAPMAGASFGLWHVPDVGEWVHVRFDHGRVDYPMWEGGWWGSGDPTDDMVAKNVVLCTKEGLKIVINRTDKSILIQQDSGDSILIDGDTITLSHTSDVVINAQGDVKVNAQSDVDITAQGDVNITAQGMIKLTGDDEIDLIGTVKVTGSITATQEIKAMNSHSVSAHTHPDPQGGVSGLPTG